MRPKAESTKNLIEIESKWFNCFRWFSLRMTKLYALTKLHGTNFVDGSLQLFTSAHPCFQWFKKPWYRSFRSSQEFIIQFTIIANFLPLGSRCLAKENCLFSITLIGQRKAVQISAWKHENVKRETWSFQTFSKINFNFWPFWNSMTIPS